MQKRGNRSKLPSRRECLELLKKHGQPQTVVAHTLVVEKAAVAISKKLRKTGEKVDLELVRVGALLHDVAKMQRTRGGELKPRRHHAEAGAKILKKEGVSKEIAKIVELHTLDAGKQPKSWEEKIVFYADKRVEWDGIVSLEDRFEALKKRYSEFPGAVQKIEKSLPFTEKIEKQIFSKIERRPEELEEIILE